MDLWEAPPLISRCFLQAATQVMLFITHTKPLQTANGLFHVWQDSLSFLRPNWAVHSSAAALSCSNLHKFCHPERPCRHCRALRITQHPYSPRNACESSESRATRLTLFRMLAWANKHTPVIYLPAQKQHDNAKCVACLVFSDATLNILCPNEGNEILVKDYERQGTRGL